MTGILHALVMLALCPWLAAPAAAQSSNPVPCSASQRWILVTVVAGGSFFPGTGDPIPAFTGPQLVDRCQFIGDGRSDFDSISPLTETQPGIVPGAVEAGARTQIIQRITGISITVLSVRETIQEICAVMDDCSDATSDRATGR